MKCYLEEKFDMPLMNANALMEVSSATAEKVSVYLIVLTHPNTYDTLKNLRQELQSSKGPMNIYIDHPKGNKEIEKS